MQAILTLRGAPQNDGAWLARGLRATRFAPCTPCKVGNSRSALSSLVCALLIEG